MMNNDDVFIYTIRLQEEPNQLDNDLIINDRLYSKKISSISDAFRLEN
jgi:hypothetical protein